MRRHLVRSQAHRRTTPRGLLARLRPSPQDDAGLSLIELMVSLLVFGLAASALAAGFISSIKVSGNDRNRLAAANLAQREIEIVRNTFTGSETGPQTVITQGSVLNPNPLPGGVAGQPLVVDGRPYTVKRTFSWGTAQNGANPCDGGSSLSYRTINLGVSVTWPGMGETIRPVESNTLLTPPRGTLSGTTSFVAVKVTKENGTPYSGMSVALRRGSAGASSATTQPDGCAVFATTGTGAHTVELDTNDNVDISGTQFSSRGINVTAGSFQKIDLSYDEEASLVTRLEAESGHAIPAGIANVTLGNSVLPDTRKTFALSAVGATTIPNLWPSGSGYAVWAGSCEQSDPAAAGGTRVSTRIAPGATSPEIAARLAPVTINVKTAGGAVLAGRTVVAQPVDPSDCVASELNLTLGTSDAFGQVKSSLPAGTWKITIAARPLPTGGWPVTSSLLPGGTVQTVEVVTT